MGKCSSKLERNEDSDSSFQGRGGKPAIRRYAPTKDATASVKPSKDKVEKEDVAVVKEEGAFRSGESSSQGSGLVRKRNSKPTGLGLKSSPETAPASSLGHEEGIETFHDASEELGPPSVPPSPSTGSPTSSKMESSIFGPAKDSSMETSPPGSGSNRDLASSETLSRVRLNSSSSLPPTRSPPEVPVPTLRPTLSQKVSEEALSTEQPAVSSVSAPIAIPSSSAAPEQVESTVVDPKTQLSAKEHETMKAFVELGDNWELVTRSPVSTIQAGKKGEPESFTTQQESRPVDKDAEKKMEVDDSASKTTLIDASAREVAPVHPLFAAESEKGKAHETSDAPETTSGSLSPAALLRNEGYTVREEPLATELKIDKPASISSRSESAGSGDFEIIRGPEDEKSTPRSPSPQISETSQPEIVDSPREVQTAVDDKRYPQFVSTPAKEVSEKSRQNSEQTDIPQSISNSPRQEEPEFTRQKSVRQIVEEIEKGAFSPTSAAKLEKAREAEAAQTDIRNAATRKIDFPVEPISAPQEQSLEKEPSQALSQHPKTIEDRPLKLAQDEVVAALFKPAAPQSELENQKDYTALKPPTSVQEDAMLEPNQEKDAQVLSAESVQAEKVEKKPPVAALEPAEATEERTRDIELPLKTPTPSEEQVEEEVPHPLLPQEPGRLEASALILAKGEEESAPLEAALGSDSEKMATLESVEEPNSVEQEAEHVEEKVPVAELERAEAAKDETRDIELPLETPTPPEELVDEEESAPLEAAPESDSEKMQTPASVEEPNAVEQEAEDVEEKVPVAELEPAEGAKDETRDIDLPLETPSTQPEEQVEEEEPRPLLPQEPDILEASPLIFKKCDEESAPLEAAPESDSEKLATLESVEEPNAVEQEAADAEEKPPVAELEPAETTEEKTRDIELPLETPTPPEELVEEEVPHPLLPQEPDRLEASPLVLAKGEEESIPLEAAPESDSEKMATLESVEEPNSAEHEAEDVEEKVPVVDLEPAEAGKEETRDIELPLETPTPSEEQVEEEAPHPLPAQEPDRLKSTPKFPTREIELSNLESSAAPEEPVEEKAPNQVPPQDPEKAEVGPLILAKEEGADPLEAAAEGDQEQEAVEEPMVSPELGQDLDVVDEEAIPVEEADKEPEVADVEPVHETLSRKIEPEVEEKDPIGSPEAEREPASVGLEPAEATTGETREMQLPLESFAVPEALSREEESSQITPPETEKVAAHPIMFAAKEEEAAPCEAASDFAPENEGESISHQEKADVVPEVVAEPKALAKDPMTVGEVKNEHETLNEPEILQVEPVDETKETPLNLVDEKQLEFTEEEKEKPVLEATKDESREIELPFETPSSLKEPIKKEVPSQGLPEEPEKILGKEEDAGAPLATEAEGELVTEGEQPVVEEPEGEPELEKEENVDENEVKSFGDETEAELEAPIMVEKKKDEPLPVDESRAVQPEPVGATNEEKREIEPPLEPESLPAESEQETELEQAEKALEVVSDQEVDGEGEETVVEAKTGEESAAVEESLPVPEEPVEATNKTREDELPREQISAPTQLVEEENSQSVEPDVKEVYDEHLKAVEEEVPAPLQEKTPENEHLEDAGSGAVEEPVDGSQVQETELDHVVKEPKVVGDERAAKFDVDTEEELAAVEEPETEPTTDETREISLEAAAAETEPGKDGKKTVDEVPLHFQEEPPVTAESDKEAHAAEEPVAAAEVEETEVEPVEPPEEETREIQLPLETSRTPDKRLVDEETTDVSLEGPESPLSEAGPNEGVVKVEPAEAAMKGTKEMELPLGTPTSPEEPLEEEVPSEVLPEGVEQSNAGQKIFPKDEEVAAPLEPKGDREPFKTVKQQDVEEPLVKPDIEQDISEKSVPATGTDLDAKSVEEPDAVGMGPAEETKDERREIEFPLETPSAPEEPSREEDSGQSLAEEMQKMEEKSVPCGAAAKGETGRDDDEPAVGEEVVEPEIEKEIDTVEQTAPLSEAAENEGVVKEEPAETAKDGTKEMKLPLGTFTSPEEPIGEEVVSEVLPEEVEKSDAGPENFPKDEEVASPWEAKGEGRQLKEVEQEDVEEPLMEPDIEQDISEKSVPATGAYLDAKAVEEPDSVEVEPAKETKDGTREIEFPLETPTPPEEPSREEESGQSLGEETQKLEAIPAPFEAASEGETGKDDDEPAVEEPVIKPEIEKQIEAVEETTPLSETVENEGVDVLNEPADATKTREIELPLETPSSREEPMVKEVPSQDLPGEPQKLNIDGAVILGQEEEEEAPFEYEKKGRLVPEVEQHAVGETVAESEMDKEVEVEVDEKDLNPPEDHEPEISRDPEVVEGEPVEATQDKSREIELPLETLISPKQPIDKEAPSQEELGPPLVGEPATELEQSALADPVGEPALEKKEMVDENEPMPGLEVEQEPDALTELEVVEGKPTEATKDENREIGLPFETPSSREEPILKEVPSQGLPEEPEKLDVAGAVILGKEEEAGAPLAAEAEGKLVTEGEQPAVEERVGEQEQETEVNVDENEVKSFGDETEAELEAPIMVEKKKDEPLAVDESRDVLPEPVAATNEETKEVVPPSEPESLPAEPEQETEPEQEEKALKVVSDQEVDGESEEPVVEAKTGEESAAVEESLPVPEEPVEATNKTREDELPREQISAPTQLAEEENSQSVEPDVKEVYDEHLKAVEEEVPAPLQEKTPENEHLEDAGSGAVEEPFDGSQVQETELDHVVKEPKVVGDERAAKFNVDTEEELAAVEEPETEPTTDETREISLEAAAAETEPGKDGKKTVDEVPLHFQEEPPVTVESDKEAHAAEEPVAAAEVEETEVEPVEPPEEETREIQLPLETSRTPEKHLVDEETSDISLEGPESPLSEAGPNEGVVKVEPAEAAMKGTKEMGLPLGTPTSPEEPIEEEVPSEVLPEEVEQSDVGQKIFPKDEEVTAPLEAKREGEQLNEVEQQDVEKPLVKPDIEQDISEQSVPPTGVYLGAKAVDEPDAVEVEPVEETKDETREIEFPLETPTPSEEPSKEEEPAQVSAEESEKLEEMPAPFEAAADGETGKDDDEPAVEEPVVKPEIEQEIEAVEGTAPLSEAVENEGVVKEEPAEAARDGTKGMYLPLGTPTLLGEPIGEQVPSEVLPEEVEKSNAGPQIFPKDEEVAAPLEAKGEGEQLKEVEQHDVEEPLVEPDIEQDISEQSVPPTGVYLGAKAVDERDAVEVEPVEETKDETREIEFPLETPTPSEEPSKEQEPSQVSAQETEKLEEMPPPFKAAAEGETGKDDHEPAVEEPVVEPEIEKEIEAVEETAPLSEAVENEGVENEEPAEAAKEGTKGMYLPLGTPTLLGEPIGEQVPSEVLPEEVEKSNAGPQIFPKDEEVAAPLEAKGEGEQLKEVEQHDVEEPLVEPDIEQDISEQSVPPTGVYLGAKAVDEPDAVEVEPVEETKDETREIEFPLETPTPSAEPSKEQEPSQVSGQETEKLEEMPPPFKAAAEGETGKDDHEPAVEEPVVEPEIEKEIEAVEETAPLSEAVENEGVENEEPAEAAKEGTKGMYLPLGTPTLLGEPIGEQVPSEVLPEEVEKSNAGPQIFPKDEEVAAPLEAKGEGEQLKEVEQHDVEEPLVEPDIEQDISEQSVPPTGVYLGAKAVDEPDAVEVEPVEETKDETREIEFPLETPTPSEEPSKEEEPAQVSAEESEKLEEMPAPFEAAADGETGKDDDEPAVEEPVVKPEIEQEIEAVEGTAPLSEAVENEGVVKEEPAEAARDGTKEMEVPLGTPTSPEEPIGEEVQSEVLQEEVEKSDAGPEIFPKDEEVATPLEAKGDGEQLKEVEADLHTDALEEPAEATKTREVELPLETPSSLQEPIVKEVPSQDLPGEPQKLDLAGPVILGQEEEEEAPFGAEKKGKLVPEVQQQAVEEAVAESEMEKEVEVDEKDLIPPEDHEPEISRDPEVVEGEPVEATQDKSREIELPSETLISPKEPIDKEAPSEEVGPPLAAEGEGEPVTEVKQPALAEPVGEPELEKKEKVDENESMPGLEVEHDPDALKEMEVVEGEPTEATKDDSREIDLPFETPSSREEPILKEVPSEGLPEEPEKLDVAGAVILGKEEEAGAPLAAVAEGKLVTEGGQPAVEERVGEPELEKEVNVDENEVKSFGDEEEAELEEPNIAGEKKKYKHLAVDESRDVLPEPNEPNNEETKEVEPSSEPESLPAEQEQETEPEHIEKALEVVSDQGVDPVEEAKTGEESAAVEESLPVPEEPVEANQTREIELPLGHVSTQGEPAVDEDTSQDFQPDLPELHSEPLTSENADVVGPLEEGKPQHEIEKDMESVEAVKPMNDSQELHAQPDHLEKEVKSFGDEEETELEAPDIVVEKKKDDSLAVDESRDVLPEPVAATSEETREVEPPSEPESLPAEPEQETEPEHVEKALEVVSDQGVDPVVEAKTGEESAAVEESLPVLEEPVEATNETREDELPREPLLTPTEIAEEENSQSVEPEVKEVYDEHLKAAEEEVSAPLQEKTPDNELLEDAGSGAVDELVDSPQEQEAELDHVVKEPKVVDDERAAKLQVNKEEELAAAEEPKTVQEEPEVSPQVEEDVEVAAEEPGMVEEGRKDEEISKEQSIVYTEPVEDTREIQPDGVDEEAKPVQEHEKEPEAVELESAETREIDVPLETPTSADESSLSAVPSQVLPQKPEMSEDDSDLTVADEEKVSVPLEAIADTDEVKQEKQLAWQEPPTAQDETEREEPLAVEKPMAVQEEPELSPEPEKEVEVSLKGEPDRVDAEEGFTSLEALLESEQEKFEDPAAVEERMAAQEEPAVSPEVEKEVEFAAKEPPTVELDPLSSATEIGVGETSKDLSQEEVEPAAELSKEETRDIKLPLEPRFTPGDPVVEEPNQTLPQKPKNVNAEALKIEEVEAVPAPLEKETPQHELKDEVESARVEEPAAGLAHIGSVFEAVSKTDEEPGAVHKEPGVLPELETDVEATAKDQVTVAEGDPEGVDAASKEDEKPAAMEEPGALPELEKEIEDQVTVAEADQEEVKEPQVDENRGIEPEVSEEEPTSPQDAELEQAEPTTDETRDFSLEAAAAETEPEKDEKKTAAGVPLQFQGKPVVTAELDKEAHVPAEEPVVAEEVEETEVEPVESQKEETSEIQLPLETSSTPDKRLVEEEPSEVPLEAPESLLSDAGQNEGVVKDRTKEMELPLGIHTSPKEQIGEEVPGEVLPEEVEKSDAGPKSFPKDEEVAAPLEPKGEGEPFKEVKQQDVEEPLVEPEMDRKQDISEKSVPATGAYLHAKSIEEPDAGDVEPAEETKNATREIEFPLETLTPSEEPSKEEEPGQVSAQETEKLEEMSAPFEAESEGETGKDDHEPSVEEPVVEPEIEQEIEAVEETVPLSEVPAGLKFPSEGETVEEEVGRAVEEPVAEPELEKEVEVPENNSVPLREADDDKGVVQVDLPVKRKDEIRESDPPLGTPTSPMEPIATPELQTEPSVPELEPTEATEDETSKIDLPLATPTAPEEPILEEFPGQVIAEDPENFEAGPVISDKVKEAKQPALEDPLDEPETEKGVEVSEKKSIPKSEADFHTYVLEEPEFIKVEPADEATETREIELPLETPSSLEEPTLKECPSQDLPGEPQKLDVAGPVILGKQGEDKALFAAKENGELVPEVQQQAVKEAVTESEMEKEVHFDEKDLFPPEDHEPETSRDPEVVEGEPVEATQDTSREIERHSETLISPKEPTDEEAPIQEEAGAPLAAEAEGEPVTEVQQPALAEPVGEPELEKEEKVDENESMPGLEVEHEPDAAKELEVAEGEPAEARKSIPEAEAELHTDVFEEPAEAAKTREIELPLETPSSLEEPIVKEVPSQEPSEVETTSLEKPIVQEVPSQDLPRVDTPSSPKEPNVKQVPSQDLPGEPQKLDVAGPVILGKQGEDKAPFAAEERVELVPEMEQQAVKEEVAESEMEKEVHFDEKDLFPPEDHELEILRDPEVVDGEPVEATQDKSRETELPSETLISPKEPTDKEAPSQEELGAPLAAEGEGEPVTEVEQPALAEPVGEPELENEAKVDKNENESIPGLEVEHEPETVKELEVVQGEPAEATKNESREIDLPSETLISPKEPTDEEAPIQEEAGAPLAAEAEGEPVTEVQQPALAEPVGEPELEKEEKVDENESMPGLEVEHEPDAAKELEVAEGEPAEARKSIPEAEAELHTDVFEEPAEAAKTREIELPLETPSSLEEPIVKEVPSQEPSEVETTSLEKPIVQEVPSQDLPRVDTPSSPKEPNVKQVPSQDLPGEPQKLDVAGPVILGKQGEDKAPFAAEERVELVPEMEQQAVKEEVAESEMEKEVHFDEKDLFPPEDHELEILRDPEVVDGEPVEATQDKSRETELPSETLISPKEPTDKEAPSQEELGAPLAAEGEGEPVTEVEQPALAEPVGEPELENEAKVDKNENESIPGLEVEHEPETVKELEVVQGEPAEATKNESREIDLPSETLISPKEPTDEEAPIQEEAGAPLAAEAEGEPVTEVQQPALAEPVGEPELEKEEKVDENESMPGLEVEHEPDAAKELEVAEGEPAEARKSIPEAEAELHTDVFEEPAEAAKTREIELPLETPSSLEEPIVKEVPSQEPSEVETTSLEKPIVQEVPSQDLPRVDTPSSPKEPNVKQVPSQDLPGEPQKLDVAGPVILGKQGEDKAPFAAEERVELVPEMEQQAVKEEVAESEMEKEVHFDEKDLFPPEDHELEILRDPEVVDGEPVEATQDKSRETELPSETLISPKEPTDKEAPSQEELGAPLAAEGEGEPVTEVEQPALAEPVGEQELENEAKVDKNENESIPGLEVEHEPETVKELEVVQGEPAEATKNESRKIDLPSETPISPKEPADEEAPIQEEAGAPLAAEAEGEPVTEVQQPALAEPVGEPELEKEETVDENESMPGLEVEHEPDAAKELEVAEGEPAEARKSIPEAEAELHTDVFEEPAEAAKTREIELPLETPSSLEEPIVKEVPRQDVPRMETPSSPKEPIVKEVPSQDLPGEPQKLDVAGPVILGKEGEDKAPFAAEETGELAPEVEQQAVKEEVAESEMEKEVQFDEKDFIASEDHEPEISRDSEVVEGEPVEATQDKSRETELPSETLISPKEPIDKEAPSQEVGHPLAAEGEGDPVTEVEQPALAELVGEPELEKEEKVDENESMPGLEVEHEPDAVKQLEAVEGEPTEATKDESREIDLPLETPSSVEEAIMKEVSRQGLPEEPEKLDVAGAVILGKEEEAGAPLSTAHIGSVFEAVSKKDEEPGAVHEEPGVLPELEKEVEATAKDQVTVTEGDPEGVDAASKEDEKPAAAMEEPGALPQLEKEVGDQVTVAEADQVEVKEPQVNDNRGVEPEVSEEEPNSPQDAELEQAEPTTDETREFEIPSEIEEASVEKKLSQDAEPEKVEAEPLKSSEVVSLEAAAAETEPEKDETKTAVEVPLHFQEEPVVTAELDKEADVVAEEPGVAAEVEETEVEPVEPQKEETREIQLPLETSRTPEKRSVEEEPSDVPLEGPEKMEVELLKLGEEEAEAPEIEPGTDEESTAVEKKPVEKQFSVQEDPAVSSDYEKVALPGQQSVSPEAETQEIGDKKKGNVADELDKKSGDPFLEGMGLDQDVNFPTNGASLENLMQSELSADDMSSTNREALQSEVDTCMCASCLYRIFLLKEHSVKIPNLEASNESIDVEVNGLENSTASQAESQTHLDITGNGDIGNWLCELPVAPGVKDSDASQNDKQNSVKRLVEELDNSWKGQETHPSNGNDPMLDESNDKPTDEPSRLEAGIPSIVPSGNLTTVY